MSFLYHLLLLHNLKKMTEVVALLLQQNQCMWLILRREQTSTCQEKVVQSFLYLGHAWTNPEKSKIRLVPFYTLECWCAQAAAGTAVGSAQTQHSTADDVVPPPHTHLTAVFTALAVLTRYFQLLCPHQQGGRCHKTCPRSSLWHLLSSCLDIL